MDAPPGLGPSPTQKLRRDVSSETGVGGIFSTRSDLKMPKESAAQQHSGSQAAQAGVSECCRRQ
jgi:hypothetical protein